jgi:general secretion pathway protein D
MTLSHSIVQRSAFSTLLILMTVILATGILHAESSVSDKVKTIAQAVRYRDEGDYRRALDILESYLSENPNEQNVLDLRNKIRESYRIITGNQQAEESVSADDLLNSVISEKANRADALQREIEEVSRVLGKNMLSETERKLEDLNAYLEDGMVDDYASVQIRELERELWLRKGLEAVETSDLEGADRWLASYRGDPSATKKLQRMENRLAEKIEAGLTRETARFDEPEPVEGKSTETLSAQEQSLFQKGRAQYLGGDYEAALATFRELEKRSPDHPQAKDYQLRIIEYFNSNAYLNHLKTREEMLAEVNRSWQRPRIFSPDARAADGENTANPIVEKIRSIKIPRVNFSNLELTSVIETLSELSVEFDSEPVAELKGVNIVPLFDPNTRDNPKVSISLRNLSLEKILQFVTQQVNFQFDIVDEAIVVQPTDGPDGAANLITEFFPVSRATVIRLTGTSGSGSSQVFSDNPFEVAEQEENNSSIGEDEGAMKGFFQRAGVEFEGIRGASLAFDGTQLIVTQTSRNLERMRNILRRYEKTRQVEIEAKFLEVQQEDLEELGVEWSVLSGSNPLFDSNGNPILNSNGNQMSSYDTNFSTSGANRSLADAFALNQSSQGIRITSPTFAGGSLTTDFNAPAIPQALDFAQSLAGGVLSTIGIIGDAELGVMVRALSRKEGSDLLSAPRLTVLSGKTANITVAQELRYPESYGDIEAEVSRDVANATASGGGGGAVAITAGTPQDFVVRNVGVEMEVTPTVEDNDNISLLLQPRVTEFEGFVEYGGPSVAISGDLTATVPSGFYQPIFSTRSVKTEVTIYDGATVVIGGLTREEIKTVDDKVPLLGDIPYLGRLFKSEGETSRKRNLLIFVTANLVGPGGGPIKQEFPEIEANSMFQNPTLVTPGGGVNREVPDSSKY